MRSPCDGKCLLGCVGLIAVLCLMGIGIFLVTHNTSPQPAADTVTAATPAAAVSPHKQRLADLHKKQESLKSNIEFELSFARSLARDAEKMSMDPTADPQDRQDLFRHMDEQKQKPAQLVADKQALDAEIVQEEQAHEGINQESDSTGTGRLTELRGKLAKRREYDLWLIRNTSNVVNKESHQEKILAYCMITVYGEKHALESNPETEYALQPDGTLVTTSGGPTKTPEQIFRDSQRMQLELETGGGPAVQDCAGSLLWYGTWHDQPMPTDEEFAATVNKAKVDIETVDRMLDPRLAGSLPR